MRLWYALVLLIIACGRESASPTPPRDDTTSVLGLPARGLVYRKADSSVAIVNLQGLEERRVRFSFNDTLLEPASGPVFSPDGVLMAFVAPYRTPNGAASVFFADTTGSIPRLSRACSRTAIAVSWAASVGWAPQGRRLALGCSSPDGQNLVLYDYTLDAIVYLFATSTLAGARGWAPNGKWVLDGNTVISIETPGRPTALRVPGGLTGLGWTPNNGVIVGPAGGCGTDVYVMRPLAGAQLVPLLPAPYRYAAFSPDGKRLLALTSVCSARDTPKAVVLDAATLNVELTIPGAVWAAWRPAAQQPSH